MGLSLFIAFCRLNQNNWLSSNTFSSSVLRPPQSTVAYCLWMHPLNALSASLLERPRLQVAKHKILVYFKLICQAELWSAFGLCFTFAAPIETHFLNETESNFTIVFSLENFFRKWRQKEWTSLTVLTTACSSILFIQQSSFCVR